MVLFCAEDAGLDVADLDGPLESALMIFRDTRVRIMFVTMLASFPMQKAWKQE